MKRVIIVLFLVLIITIVSHAKVMDKETPSASRQEWTVFDSKAYARNALMAWNEKQYHCLNKLWTKESNWRPKAYNKYKVMGKNAGGIPQILGLSPETPATLQIDRGLSYIFFRYTTPCKAWKFHQRKGYY